MKYKKKITLHYKNGKTRVITDEIDKPMSSYNYLTDIYKKIFATSSPIALLETKNDVILILDKYEIGEITVSKENEEYEIEELLDSTTEETKIEIINKVSNNDAIEIEEINKLISEETKIVDDELDLDELLIENPEKEIKIKNDKKKKKKETSKHGKEVKDNKMKNKMSEAAQRLALIESVSQKGNPKKYNKKKKTIPGSDVPRLQPMGESLEPSSLQDTLEKLKNGEIKKEDFTPPISLTAQVDVITGRGSFQEDKIFNNAQKGAPNVLEIQRVEE